ncbi:uncharacterized protein LOC113359254 [Papaver somniferum]|uniref:uncharacterized protein LOC113359254 n=1 Tax=Papaver somniferum TaxID=3469 RepID=UPI000E704CDA|nr:uncharacterized protein LOC113359254 [Papaver somniferum]
MRTLLAPFRYPNIIYLQPVGRSGGLVLMWKNGFVCDIVGSDDNMFRAIVQSNPNEQEWLFSCMYGYCDYSKKKNQWEFIKDIGSNINQSWVLLGDLNFHLQDNTSHDSSSSYGLVNSILHEIGLEDLGFIGRDHTWTNNNLGTGNRRSRIDMALVNADWNSQFQDSNLLHLTQHWSDHCPIMLVTDYSFPNLWKPFKFFFTWLNDSSCSTEISKSWEKEVHGSPGHKFIKRLQFTRAALSKWNKQHFGNINHNVDNLQQELDEIQKLPFSRENTIKAEDVSKELNKWHQIQNISTSTSPVIEEKHYSILPNVISDEDNRRLLFIPTDEEVLKTLKSIENWSVPGPEGFQDGFYKSQWNTIGPDLCEMVKRFFTTKHLSKHLNKTFISLIPKKSKTKSPLEFRLIGLCNTSYKIISKILVNRMKPFMDSIISPYQAAYVSGRLINDNTIISHELIRSMKRKKGESGWLGSQD